MRALVERLDEVPPLVLARAPDASKVVKQLHPDAEDLGVGRGQGDAVGQLAAHEDDAVRVGEVGVVGQDEVGLGERLAGVVLGERGEQDGRRGRDRLVDGRGLW